MAFWIVIVFIKTVDNSYIATDIQYFNQIMSILSNKFNFVTIGM